MPLSASQPWQPEIAWDSPAGRTLDELIDCLPTSKAWQITVFGSAPLQLGLDRTLLSNDVDVIIPGDPRELLQEKGLLMGQREPYVELCPWGAFRVSPHWSFRACRVPRRHATIILPHPLDLLIGKVHRLEEKDLRAFKLVQAKTGMPSEEEFKGALREVVDFFRPRFDEEAGRDLNINVRYLWQQVFGHDIDVRAEIIRPALAERAKAYGLDSPRWTQIFGSGEAKP